MNIEILHSSKKEIPEEYIATLTAFLNEKGCSVAVRDISGDRMKQENNCNSPVADLYIVLGGDGSIIRAAHHASVHDIPILGINFGTIGCLVELEKSEIDRISDYFNGNFIYDRRSMLDVSVTRDGQRIGNIMHALNDAVIYHGDKNKLVDAELYSDGGQVTRYRCDGLILSTPTGSTGYSMSAGGCIVSPKAEVTCVTPICAHTLWSRPLIFSDNSVLEVVSLARGDGKMLLTVDGFEENEIYSGDTVRVTRSERSVRLVRLGSGHTTGEFYERTVKKIL